jgi:hypothetical protein
MKPKQGLLSELMGLAMRDADALDAADNGFEQ